MKVPKIYDQETYEDYVVRFYSTNAEKLISSYVWDEEENGGSIFKDENLKRINSMAKCMGYDTFEISKETRVVHRYAVENE